MQTSELIFLLVADGHLGMLILLTNWHIFLITWFSRENEFYLSLAFALNYRRLPYFITQDFKISYYFFSQGCQIFHWKQVN